MSRVVAKLGSEPIEDLRIDFEDGYGDRARRRGGPEVAARRARPWPTRRRDGPPFTGIRFKSLEAPTRERGLRTLELFIAALAERAAAGRVRGHAAQGDRPSSRSRRWWRLCERLERSSGWRLAQLRFEIQVETPQAILGPTARPLVARMVHAAAGR